MEVITPEHGDFGGTGAVSDPNVRIYAKYNNMHISIIF
jgi:hypothetical protein